MGCWISSGGGDGVAATAAAGVVAGSEDRVPTTATKWTFAGLTTQARVTGVYDGDTVYIVTRRSAAEPYAQYTLRLLGVDAPEMRPPMNTPNRALHIEAAKHARQCLSSVVLGKQVTVAFVAEEKYGRLLGTVYMDNRAASVNEWLAASGLAHRYGGTGQRVPWTVHDLTHALTAVPCTH